MDSFNIIKYVYSPQHNDNKEIGGKLVLFADALKDNVWFIVNYVISVSVNNKRFYHFSSLYGPLVYSQ